MTIAESSSWQETMARAHGKRMGASMARAAAGRMGLGLLREGGTRQAG